MICPKKVQDACLFGMMCSREPVVDDDGECAAYIRKTLAALDGAQPGEVDPVEAAELQQERAAIREETLRNFKPTYLCEPYRPRGISATLEGRLDAAMICPAVRLECGGIGRQIIEGLSAGLSRANQSARKLAEEVKRMCDNGSDV